MIQLVIKDLESYDEGKSEFVTVKGQTIQVEHSLVSISKWESKWNKPFLGKTEKTVKETIDYVKCMTITQNVRDEVYNNLTNDNMETIGKYIAATMSATRIHDDKEESSREILTSEIIYYYMIALNIPISCEKWHLNRLLTLIRVCNKKNAPVKKMSRSEIISRNRELNNQRKQQYQTNG